MRILTLLATCFFAMSTLLGQANLVLTEIMYNSPGEDLEFLEFYNNSTDPLDLTGYAITEGVDYTFPSVTLAPNQAFVVTGDSCIFNVVYSSFLTAPVEEWTGSLNNGGDRIVVTDANQDVIIDVTYNDVAPWPNLADGFGPSIFLCDPNSDMTQGESWLANVGGTTLVGPIFANPNVVDATLDCNNPAEFWLSNNSDNFYFENSDTIEIAIFRQSNSMQTDTVIAALSGLLIEGTDYEIITDTLIYNAGQTGPEFFQFSLIDDSEAEEFKNGFLDVFDLGSTEPSNFFTITSINLIDNDGDLTNKIELRGVLENSDFKALEFFVKSDLGIGELANFSLGAANNGNGSDGTEHFIEPGFVAEGECFFIANDTVRFKKFMGFEAGEVSLLQIDNFNFNGNDAVELFEKGQLIDVFGFQNEDGEGTIWEYTDGWAKKITAGNRSTFEPSNWNYGGVSSIDAEENDLAANPYPLECLPTSVENVQISAEVDVYPNPTSGQFTINADQRIERIRLIDLAGRIVYEKNAVNTSIHTIDPGPLQSGVYIAQIKLKGVETNFRVVID